MQLSNRPTSHLPAPVINRLAADTRRMARLQLSRSLLVFAAVGLLALIGLGLAVLAGQWIPAGTNASPVGSDASPTGTNESPVGSNASTTGTPPSSASAQASPQGEYRNIIFLHHSVGANLIKGGDVRKRFTEAGYRFSDHGYNEYGLRGPDGVKPGLNFRVPDDNTDPGGLVNIFRQPLISPPDNTFSALLQYDVILFKSCYTANEITSDRQLQEYQDWYLEMRGVMDQYPGKLFIVLTPPPRHPDMTTPEQAQRARAFANWLASEEYIGGRRNLAVFDFYNLLAESDPSKPDVNMLRSDYRAPGDSHPTGPANKTIGPLLVEFVLQAIQQARGE